MHPPKSTDSRRTTILPRFMPTSVRTKTSQESTPRASPAKAGRRVSVQGVLSVTAVEARRVAGSAMTSVRRVVHVRTSRNV